MSSWNALIGPPRAVSYHQIVQVERCSDQFLVNRLRYKFRPIYPDLDYIKSLNPSKKRAFEKNVFQLAVV